MKNISFRIRSDYQEVSKLCSKIGELCFEHFGSKTKCGEIEICILESLNNVVRHSYKEDFTKEIEIILSLDEENFTIELRDEGFSRKVFTKPTLDFDPNDIDSLPEGGMGLYIIDQIMDEHTYRTENGVNIFTMKKKVV